MLLTDKHVLVFADAAEKLAAAIVESGGRAQAAEVDAEDQAAVDAHVAATAASAGRLDAVFNGIGGRPADLAHPRTLVDLDLDGFLRPIARIVGSQYLTSRAAGLVMARQGHGSVITLSATLSGWPRRTWPTSPRRAARSRP